MPASPADSSLYSRLLGDAETARFFSDAAELRAMMLVEGELARVQGGLGLIPKESGDFLARASREIQLDPAALAAETETNGVPVPALVAALRKALQAPEHAQYLHWGATSQDIMDTGLALRLKRVLDLWEERLAALLRGLAALAEAHAELPMAARTYGQVATPTSFGAVVASWGWPLLAHLGALPRLREAVLRVSLSGAAGTLSAMGPQGREVRAGLARALGLADPGHSWHSDRSGMAALAGWIGGLAGSLGKIGEDLILMTQSGIGEATIAGGGASSTMPQKQNPVGPSVLVALARHAVGLSASLTGAGLHRQQRDGAAWFIEWLTLPQLCIDAGRMLALADDLAGRTVPDAAAMARELDGGLGLIYSETLTFALARHCGLSRPEAQALVKQMSQDAEATQTPLIVLAQRAYPDKDWARLLTADSLGDAPLDARGFAAAVGRIG